MKTNYKRRIKRMNTYQLRLNQRRFFTCGDIANYIGDQMNEVLTDLATAEKVMDILKEKWMTETNWPGVTEWLAGRKWGKLP